MLGRQQLNTLIFLELIHTGQLTLPQFISGTIRYLQAQLRSKIAAMNLEIAQIENDGPASEHNQLSVATLQELVGYLQADYAQLEAQLNQYQKLRFFVASNGTRYFFTDEIAAIKSTFSNHMLLAAEDIEVFDDIEAKIDLLVCQHAFGSAQFVDNYKDREGRLYAVFHTDAAMKEAVSKLLGHFTDSDASDLYRLARQANTIELLSPQLIDAAYLLRNKTPALTR
jgi:hypothetical protein